MNDIVNNEVVLFRYLRPMQITTRPMQVVKRNSIALEPAPRGGISFLFKILQDQGALVVSWTICPDDVNFSYKIGKDITTGRMAKNISTIIVNYKRELSLIDNIISSYTENQDQAELKSICSKIRQIRKINEKVENKLYKSIT